MRKRIMRICSAVMAFLALTVFPGTSGAESETTANGIGDGWVDGPEELRPETPEQQFYAARKKTAGSRQEKKSIDQMSAAAEREREMRRGAKPQIEIRR